VTWTAALHLPTLLPALRHLLLAALVAACALLGPGLLAWDADRLQRSADRLGAPANDSVRLLRALLREPVAGTPERLEAINQFYNRRILFREDTQTWGQADYWASPLETLARGAGDCEDFAIAKFFSLVAAGVPAPQLRLVYVRARIGGPLGPSIAHMVLAWYATPEAEPLILDNLVTEVRPASRRPDLEPVFSFNAEGLWQGAGTQPAGDPLVRLSRWRDILDKAREEGFL
jgi:predicted transglutaminase-like cysteine proteinase